MSTIPIISNNYNVPINGFKFDYVFQMQLGISATFTVFLTYNGTQMYSKQITMSGNDYKNWGNDDDYVQKFVARQLGFTISTEPVVLQTGSTGSDASLSVTGSTGSDASLSVTGSTGFDASLSVTGSTGSDASLSVTGSTGSGSIYQ